MNYKDDIHTRYYLLLASSGLTSSLYTMPVTPCL